MSRPKGSKNKKSRLSEAQIAEKISQQQTLRKNLEDEQLSILNTMADLKGQLKQNKKAIRTVEKTIAGLEEKKEQAQAIAAAAAQKKEIDRVVSSLVSSGKTAEEILELLQK